MMISQSNSSSESDMFLLDQRVISSLSFIFCLSELVAGNTTSDNPRIEIEKKERESQSLNGSIDTNPLISVDGKNVNLTGIISLNTTVLNSVQTEKVGREKSLSEKKISPINKTDSVNNHVKTQHPENVTKETNESENGISELKPEASESKALNLTEGDFPSGRDSRDSSRVESLNRKRITDEGINLEKDEISTESLKIIGITQINNETTAERESAVENSTLSEIEMKPKDQKERLDMKKSENDNPSLRRKRTSTTVVDNEERDKASKAYLLAFRNCKLIKGKNFVRENLFAQNKEIRECITNELQKLETYPNQYIKYMDNSQIIRRA